jgi:hypothetical protein
MPKTPVQATAVQVVDGLKSQIVPFLMHNLTSVQSKGGNTYFATPDKLRVRVGNVSGILKVSFYDLKDANAMEASRQAEVTNTIAHIDTLETLAALKAEIARREAAFNVKK